MARHVIIATLLPLVATLANDVDDVMNAVQEKAPELFMGAEELARKDGYPMETHTVKTSDGYLLDLHRIPGRGAPVFLQHGFLCASHMWILHGPKKALGYLLADEGYDVWMGNSRGNTYAKKHVRMSSEDLEFWNFSWHEMGLYDLPASIDYILNATGHKQLFYVGHSMGNTMALVLLSMKPEYNHKIRFFVALAPAAFMGETRSTLIRMLLPLSNIITETIEGSGLPELLPYSPERASLGYFLCRDGSSSQPLCVDMLDIIYGRTTVNKSNLPFYLAHLTMGASVKTTGHFLQIIDSGIFRAMDYGKKNNMRTYRSTEPPGYNLTQVTVPTLLAYSEGDIVVDYRDVIRLSKRLPKATLYRIPQKYFSHIDYILHQEVRSLLYDHVLKIMKKYSEK